MAKRIRPAGMTRKQWSHDYYLNHKEVYRNRMRKYTAEGREWVAAWKRRAAVKDAQTKLDVLSHYGKDGKLQCCWPECDVTDPDMLSVDHIANDGAADKRAHGTKVGGIKTYRLLKKTEYPEGFQTLCHNHQWKKELMRRRGE